MQTLVIGVGEFGLNVACQFFTHLVLEHDMLNLLEDTEQSKLQRDHYGTIIITILSKDYNAFFSEANQENKFQANLLIFDTTYDTYLQVIKNYPLIVPFVNRSQIISLSQLPGGSHHLLLSTLRGKSSVKDLIRDILRKEMEKKIYYAIMMFHSIAGGTGSGLTSCLLAELSILRSRLCVTINFMLIPSEAGSRFSNNCLEWYNATSALETVSESCEMTIILDNQALAKIYKNTVYGVDDQNIQVQDLNTLIIHLAASLTSTLRYKSKVPKRFQDIILNTVLYRSIHFVVPTIFDPHSIIRNYQHLQEDSQQQQTKNFDQSFQQLQSPPLQRVYNIKPQQELKKKYGKYRFFENQTYKTLNVEPLQNFATPTSMLIDLFDRQNCLATCDEVQPANVKQFYNPRDKYVSAFTAFNTQHPETVISQAFVCTKEYLIKTTQNDFMSMSPCPFSYSLTHQNVFHYKKDQNTYYTQQIETGACMLQNKFTIHNIFDRIHRQVTGLYQRKVFFQWIDQQEIQKQIDGVKCLERDYGDWIQAEEIVHLFEESLREEDIQSQSDSLSDTF